MPCTDPNMVNFPIAHPGDICDIWLENCSSFYYHSGLKTFVDAKGARTDSAIGESQLSQANPLRYVYNTGELYVVSILFDPTGSTGRSAEVYAEVRSTSGVIRHRWCTKMESGTPAPDYASFALKGV